jgi:cytochrome c oxidase subunit 2
MNDALNPVKSVDQAFAYIAWISVFFLTLITVLMIYFVIRYSRKRNPVAADIRGNWKLEVVWTVIPTLIALSMFYLGWHSYIKLRNVPPDAMVVEVTARAFAWEFKYPDGTASDKQLVVPKGKPVKLNLTSKDVLHSIFIPAFRIKMDTVPGMKTYTWFYPADLGEYDIFCAEYCGTGHADMTARLKVVEPAAYEAWLQSQKGKPDDDL